MASVDSLDSLLEEELKDLYDAEKQLTKALPKLAKKATSDELRQAIEEHLRQTEEHVERLEQVFEQLELPVKGKKCVGMKNLISEGDDMIGDAEEGPARDAVMIAAAQKVEHYEIASYGTVRTWASRLGHDEVASILEETLEEEKEADQKLTGIAESIVNPAAETGEDEEEENGRSMRSGSTARAGRQIAADRGSRSTASSSRRGASKSRR